MSEPLYQTRMWPMADLLPAEYNPRVITKARLEDLKRNMKADPKFIHARPLIVNIAEGRSGVIIGGHMRFLAAKELGWQEIPCTEVEAVTLQEEQSWNIKDNSHHGDFDRDKLAEIVVPNAIDFALSMPSDQLDSLINDYGVAEDAKNEEEQTALIAEREPITKPGDVWILGEHILLCGDSTKPQSYGLILGGERANMCWTDPPYNVDYTGKTKDALKIESDAMDRSTFKDFMIMVVRNILENTEGACYVCMSTKEMGTLKDAWDACGGHWSTFIIWVKQTFVMGRSDFQNQHEPILYGKSVKKAKGEAILYGWGEGGKHEWFGGRDESNVWLFDRPKENPIHPTMKPVELVVKAVTLSSRREGIVLDPFGGGGSTLIACEKTGRKARVIELDPRYCDAIIARWVGHTKQYELTRNGEAHTWTGPVINLSGIHG